LNPRGKPAPRGGRNERSHRINEEITVPEVRLVGEANESDNGVIPTEKALQLAEQREVDLVEIAAAANPPVVRLIEYSKFIFEVKKKEKENKAKQHVVVLKEIRFGPNTDEHDFDFKVKHARKFLEDGNKVKTFVHFKGRTIMHKDRGYKMLEEFAQALDDLSKIESPPRLEGKRLYMILTPKK
jgi:translation initiation factor IF-3